MLFLLYIFFLIILLIDRRDMMKKIYSLKKEILFKNNIYDIVSIALDKKFSLDEYELKGLFKINGEYLIKENEKDEFNIDIPYLNYIEDTYDVSNIKVDIDDFYYEIKDSNKLVINIDILVEGLEEKRCVDLTDEFFTENIESDEEVKEEVIDDNTNEEKIVDIKDNLVEEKYEDVYTKQDELECVENNDEVIIQQPYEKNIINTNDIQQINQRKEIIEENYIEEKHEYVTYRICIVRPGDTIDTILQRFNTDLDTLKKYNIINDLNVGDKIIIPYERNK